MSSSSSTFTGITGIVLAGGRGSRMGGQDKGLVLIDGKPMVGYVIDALASQVGAIIVNANRNASAYAALGSPVVPDGQEGFLGPLAGMLSGMRAADTEFVLTVPCDSPLIRADLAVRLHRQLEREGADVCVAHDGERTHPVIALIRRSLHSSMAAFLEAGERKIDRWYAQHHTVYADFSDDARSLTNINHPEELRAVERILR